MCYNNQALKERAITLKKILKKLFEKISKRA